MLNQLLYGDNLEVMRKMQSESIDLIYLDPPFNSNRNYNFLYSQATGKPLPEEAEAFCDTWKLDIDKEEKIETMAKEMLECGINKEFIKFWQNWILALRNTNSKLLAYMVFMTERIVEIRRLLKPTGSIYLHCDPTASHYIKIIMDGIFGYENFRRKNEIIWCYRKWAVANKQFSRNHDTIFLYSKTDRNYFQIQYQERAKSTLKRFGNKKIVSAFDENGRRVPSQTLEEESKGVKMADWWDLPIIAPSSKERLGYPTQKPIALLDRIIQASCPENGIVLDPFCGCGTTVISAQNNKRKWIGIDICMLAVNSVEARLKTTFSIFTKRKRLPP